jgi:hypothetical protein
MAMDSFLQKSARRRRLAVDKVVEIAANNGVKAIRLHLPILLGARS